MLAAEMLRGAPWGKPHSKAPYAPATVFYAEDSILISFSPRRSRGEVRTVWHFDSIYYE